MANVILMRLLSDRHGPGSFKISSQLAHLMLKSAPCAGRPCYSQFTGEAQRRGHSAEVPRVQSTWIQPGSGLFYSVLVPGTNLLCWRRGELLGQSPSAEGGVEWSGVVR